MGDHGQNGASAGMTDEHIDVVIGSRRCHSEGLRRAQRVAQVRRNGRPASIGERLRRCTSGRRPDERGVHDERVDVPKRAIPTASWNDVR